MDNAAMTAPRFGLRRAVDMVVSLTALVLLAPAFLVIAAQILVLMGTPVLFRQRRLGLHGKEFQILKFRTMRPAEYLGQSDVERLTPLGARLRRLSMDELPQLVNILRGDMSLIGPRPGLPKHLRHYDERQRGRLAVRPGLTGWAQVNGRNSVSLPERIELDLWYLEHRSLLVDLRILAATVAHLVRPRDVVGPGGANPEFPGHTDEADTDEDHRPTVLYAVTVGLTARTLLRDQFASMHERGYRVVLLCRGDPEAVAFAEESGVEFIPLSMKRGLLTPGDLGALVRAVVILRRLRPDVVQFSTPKAGLLIGLAGFVSRVPTRIYGMTGLRLEGERACTLRYRALRLAEYLTCKSAHTVLLPSESLRERSTSLGLVHREKIRVLGRGSTGGVDLERFRPANPGEREELRHARGIGPDLVVFGFVGRIVFDKGVQTLLDAFDALPRTLRSRARLLLVGEIDDDHLLRAETLARLRHDPHLIRTGFVPDPSGIYRLMDVMMLPSRREGFPNVLLEAAACGLPAITTNATGCRDAVQHGVTGLIVPTDDAAQLREAMTTLGENQGERDRMGVAARAFVEKYYDSTAVLSMTADFIDALVRDRATRALASGNGTWRHGSPSGAAR